jgi:hypothetical protein
MYVHAKTSVDMHVSGNGLGMCDYLKGWGGGGHVSGQKWGVTWIMLCGLIASLHFTHFHKRLQSFHNLHHYLCMCLLESSSHCTVFAHLTIYPSIYPSIHLTNGWLETKGGTYDGFGSSYHLTLSLDISSYSLGISSHGVGTYGDALHNARA